MRFSLFKKTPSPDQNLQKEDDECLHDDETVQANQTPSSHEKRNPQPKPVGVETPEVSNPRKRSIFNLFKKRERPGTGHPTQEKLTPNRDSIGSGASTDQNSGRPSYGRRFTMTSTASLFPVQNFINSYLGSPGPGTEEIQGEQRKRFSLIRSKKTNPAVHGVQGPANAVSGSTNCSDNSSSYQASIEQNNQTQQISSTLSTLRKEKSRTIPTIENRINFLKKENYEFVREVDSGAFSTIYQCYTYDANRQHYEVAIKRISLKKKSNKKFLSRFLEREIMIHCCLRHPNIVKYFNTLLDDSCDIYLVLEWLQRGNLLDYCRLHGRLNEGLVKVVSYQMMSALNYMHKNFIVHGKGSFIGIFGRTTFLFFSKSVNLTKTTLPYVARHQMRKYFNLKL